MNIGVVSSTSSTWTVYPGTNIQDNKACLDAIAGRYETQGTIRYSVNRRE
jgi:hypothetical protein